MGHLDSRGHEVLDNTPVESIVQIPERMSVFDMVRQQVLAMRNEIDNDQEVSDVEEMDFVDDESGLLPDGGPYAVPDDIPDRITPDMLDVSETPPAPEATPSDSPESNPPE